MRNSAELVESGPMAYATLPTPSKRSLRSSQLGPGSVSNLDHSNIGENGRIAGRLSESPSVYKMSEKQPKEGSPIKPIRARNKSSESNSLRINNCVQAKAMIHSEEAPKGNISEVITPSSRDHTSVIPTSRDLQHSTLTATTLLNAEMKSKLSSMERSRTSSTGVAENTADHRMRPERPISGEQSDHRIRKDQSDHRIRNSRSPHKEITQNALNRYKRIQCTKL